MTATPVTKSEPVRLVSVSLAAVLAVGGFLTAWGGGVDWRLALGGALTAAATALAGGEWARSQVYSPATANEIMDAHAVIGDLERRG